MKILRKAKLEKYKYMSELKNASFIPAFGYSFLTPFYDFMMKWANVNQYSSLD